MEGLEAVRRKITGIISVDEQTMDKLMKKLEELGVESVEDLVDLQIDDLTPEILLPIPARKLIRMCGRSAVASLSDSTLEGPVTPSPSTSRAMPSTTVTPATPLSANQSNCSNPNWHTSFDVIQTVTYMLHSSQLLFTQQAATSLVDGLKLSAAHRNEVVRCVVDDIVKLCKTPSRKQLNTVAEKLVTKWCTLKDEFGGCTIGCGYTSLRNQIENRVAYLKRPVSVQRKSGSNLKRRLEYDENSRKVIRDGYGCVDFLPVNLPEEETAESLNQKQQQLKEMHSQRNWREADVTTMMAATYISQRQDLVGGHVLSMAEIQAEWPFLVQPKWMVQHLERLVGFNIIEKLEEGLLSKKDMLFNYLNSKATSMPKLSKRLKTLGVESIAVIPALLTYLGENETVLLTGHEVCYFCILLCCCQNLIPGIFGHQIGVTYKLST